MDATESRPRQDGNEMMYENKITNIMAASQTHLVVATLIVTVTFAAVCTLPGGFETDPKTTNKGTPILIRNAAFCTFVVADVIVFACSTGTMYIHFVMANTRLSQANNSELYQLVRKLYWEGSFLQCAAMVAVIIAFVTGMYATLAHLVALAVAIYIITSTCFLVYFRVWFHLFKYRKGLYE